MAPEIAEGGGREEGNQVGEILWCRKTDRDGFSLPQQR
jgi:hypothetical protein